MKFNYYFLALFLTGCTGPASTSLWMTKQTTYYNENGTVNRVEIVSPDHKSQRIASGFGTTVITGNGLAGAVVAGSVEIGEAIAKTVNSSGEVVTQKVGEVRILSSPQPVPTPTPTINK